MVVQNVFMTSKFKKSAVYFDEIGKGFGADCADFQPCGICGTGTFDDAVLHHMQ